MLPTERTCASPSLFTNPIMQQNNMSVKPKPKAPSRAITRFRITSRTNPPGEHQQPISSYFQRVADPPRLLAVSKEERAAGLQQPSKISNQMQLQTSNMATMSSQMLMTAVTQLQSTGLAAEERQSPLKEGSSPTKEAVKLQTIGSSSKLETMGSVASGLPVGEISKHISYQQYEVMLDQHNLNPTYFEKLAKKNDQKHEATLVQTNQSTKEIFIDNHDKQNKVRPLIRPKTEISIETNSQKTIISCHIGALSTHAIKEKLESKWEEEGRANRMNINNYTFTEESDFASDADTHRQTTREELAHHSIRHQQQQKHKITNKQKHLKGGKMVTQPAQDLQKPVDWDRINNERFKATLKHILEIKRQSGFRKREVDFSCGQEYQQHQQSLAALNEVYRPRLLQLKHKLEWKI